MIMMIDADAVKRHRRSHKYDMMEHSRPDKYDMI
jgi:hypothetical protein